ncbi:selenocysteine-specific translation elongation factor [Sediminibacillus dalangtanensis]|uniref:Selenocysteine-specific elongation factor n=1 Tax=Sediminibacillus dalangtanensis TaxID=2729421 RepID=A0ABX7VRP2_9BACI|nr:selenocysteine-specific translation elongation factor [Sediminibacillus dalangtanensis]QTM99183.1 selenocysteine-specific translation elongation factor [Sediminibacillus dalangtanensis]
MDETYYTIGMAGHIDHGKTTLTKALTNVDTDRLKEEKERSISIEAGYAPLHTEDGTHVSIVDVPGHERFIRQMIAGVAGIDLVVLVVAADEGVMPQTKEHLEILQFLGIKRCLVAVTKIDRVDEELQEFVGSDIKEALSGTIFSEAEMVFVDSVSGKGVEELRSAIFSALKQVEFRDRFGSFRLPIDQVFTVQGQGTIVRGTIYEGVIRQGSSLTVLPAGKKVRARNIQVHHENVQEARAGQRTAVNITGADREQINRGDVLVASNHFLVSKTIDVAVRLVDDMEHPIKQRAPIKLHIGTSEVMGKIVFFDRNEAQTAQDEILCQLRLEEEVVVRRGDRFIIRRPTPVETIGGGWVIDPKGEKYRFGTETTNMLEQKKVGTPEDLIAAALNEHTLLNEQQIIQNTSLDNAVVMAALNSGIQSKRFIPAGKKFVLTSTFEKGKKTIEEFVVNYQLQHPMRPGVNKAELRQSFLDTFPRPFIDFVITEMLEQGIVKQQEQYLSTADFRQHLPPRWKARLEEIIDQLKEDGLQVRKWEEYFVGTPLPEAIAGELKSFLLQTGQAYALTDDMIIDQQVFLEAVKKLRKMTNETFGLQDVKGAWDVSRKYMIPLLELLDQWGWTTREEGNRRWLHSENG